MNITVVDWIDKSDIPEDADHHTVMGWMGGWFNFDEGGLRWKDYLKNFKEEVHPYLEAVRTEILEHGYKFSGKQHQNNSGVPKFSDGRYIVLSWRAWGDLMAAIWSEEEDKDYSYMCFYM